MALAEKMLTIYQNLHNNVLNSNTYYTTTLATSNGNLVDNSSYMKKNNHTTTRQKSPPRNHGIKDHRGSWHLYGLSIIISTIHHHCRYTHTRTSPRSNTPSYEVSEEDQEMMKRLHVPYKTPCFWSNPQPPHLLFLSCCFSPISRLMWGGNVPPWKWNRTNKWDWVCWPHFVIPHKTWLLMQA